MSAPQAATTAAEIATTTQRLQEPKWFCNMMKTSGLSTMIAVFAWPIRFVATVLPRGHLFLDI